MMLTIGSIAGLEEGARIGDLEPSVGSGDVCAESTGPMR